jgi:hypothetical protein
MMLTNPPPSINAFATLTCSRSFFGLKPWYAYLQYNKTTCAITSFNGPKGTVTNVLGAHSAFLLIGLAILDDLVRIAALVAVGYVIYGGIQYVTSQGSPDATKKAQQTIINALIGLVVAVTAAAIVSFIGGKLGGLSS